MRGRLLRVGDEDWDRYLAATPHDFYHLPSYVALCAHQDAGEPCAVMVEDGGATMFLPLVLRPISGGGVDATSPYGYPGPLLSGPVSSVFLRDALTEAATVLAREGVISLFVRFHPLLNDILPDGVGTLVQHGDTVCVDLRQSDEELWRQTRSNHRLQINRALRAGFLVRLDETKSRDEDFRRLYRETMARTSAADYYYFDNTYFDDLQAALGDSLLLVTVEFDGDLAAAGLFVETDGFVQYHLSGADVRFLEHQPTKLLIHHARTLAKLRGNQWLHLGGGLGASDDSLLHFKAGFSHGRRPFHTLRLVVQEREYIRLVHEWSPDADPGDLVGFFPPYRRRATTPLDSPAPHVAVAGDGL